MLFGKRDPIYAHERAILDALVAAAPPTLAQTLREQVQQIRYVQRSPASPEINFYARRKGGGWNEDWLVPNRGDVRLAEVAVRISGRHHKGVLHAVSGHIFSLVLRPEVIDPKRAVVEHIDVELAEVESLAIQGGHAREALAVTPPSFLDRGPDSTNRAAGAWAVHDPEDLYLVALPLADWAVLAQGPGGHLLLGRRIEEGESFCLANVEENVIRPLAASSWGAALREVETGAS